MYAIVECGGRQYRAEEGQTFSVEKLPNQVGEQIELDNVLLLSDGDSINIGQPTVQGASVLATITDQYRGKKVFVFKYKPKKRYRKRRGHRQSYTKLRIDAIVTNGQKPAAAADDLTKLEGVGPKIAEVLTNAGVGTYAALAQQSAQSITDMLHAAGNQYNRAVPDTWPEQAALAAAGDWDALKALQDELDGGRRV